MKYELYRLIPKYIEKDGIQDFKLFLYETKKRVFNILLQEAMENMDVEDKNLIFSFLKDDMSSYQHPMNEGKKPNDPYWFDVYKFKLLVK